MARKYDVTITNGTGSESVLNGKYNATVTATGYDASTLLPTSIDVVDGVETYAFTIESTGTLTLKVVEETTLTPIEGATFYRCDKDGNTYGSAIITNASGIATMEKVPYSETSAPNVYYKQTTSDSTHNFDPTLKTITLDAQTKEVQITNTKALAKTFTLKDKNYEGLPVETATLTLDESAT